MQGRGERNDALLLGGDGISGAALHQAIEQQLRDVADAPHVRAALAVAELNDLAQHAHQHVRVALTGMNFVGHHLSQMSLLCVQLDGVGHATANNLRIKGAIDVIARTQVVGLAKRGEGVIAGNHNHRDVFDGMAGIHSFQHLEAIHHRHDDVEQHQSNVCGSRPQLLHAFLSVLRFENAVVVPKNLRQYRAVHRGVIHKQNLRFRRHGALIVHVGSSSALVVCAISFTC